MPKARPLEGSVQRLIELKGVSETTSTALLAMIGNASEFAKGRHLAARFGLVPGQLIHDN